MILLMGNVGQHRSTSPANQSDPSAEEDNKKRPWVPVGCPRGVRSVGFLSKENLVK
jgi:hypothetical protein